MQAHFPRVMSQHAAAAKKAFARWANAPGWADKSQAFLARKEVLGFGVKQGEHGELLVLGRDVDGFIHTVQSISEAGKFFTKGSRKSGIIGQQIPVMQAED